MDIRFFVDACETLGRFASVRENAKEPQDRIFVQSYAGRLKLVAGTDDMTVIVDCGPSGAVFKALVNARLLLSAGKALRGKGTVDVFPTPDGVMLRVSTGGEVRLPNVASSLPAYVRPFLLGFKGSVGAGVLPAAARRVTAVSGDGWMSQVVVGVGGGGVSFRAMDRHLYAEHPANAPLTGVEEEAVPVAFVEALRGLEGEADVVLSGGHVSVVSGPFTAVTVALGTRPIPRWPSDPENSSVVTDRKQLIQMVKGSAPHDTYNRVVLTASGASISVSPWGKDDAGMSLPAKVTGVGGQVGVTADYLLKLLNVIPTPKAGLAWEAGATGVIRVFGENDPWRQLLAPVAL